MTTLDLVTRLLGAGLAMEDIGVISPYWAQVATIRSVLLSKCVLYQVIAFQ